MRVSDYAVTLLIFPALRDYDICRFLVIIEFSRELTRRSRLAWKMTSMIDREDNGIVHCDLICKMSA